MNNYTYEILNYWDDGEDNLYVDYIVTDSEKDISAHTINIFNIYYDQLSGNFNSKFDNEFKKELLCLLKKGNGQEFKLPKVSELSPLLKHIYDFVCESEANMCHIDYNDWEELKIEDDFLEEDLSTLKKEIEKYNLSSYITLDDGEYKICGYGGLQCCFNDDRKRNDEHER